MLGNHISLSLFLLIFFNSTAALPNNDCEKYSSDDCAICCSIPVASLNENDKYYVASEAKETKQLKTTQSNKRSAAIHESKVGSVEKKNLERELGLPIKKAENEKPSECLKKCLKSKKIKK